MDLWLMRTDRTWQQRARVQLTCWGANHHRCRENRCWGLYGARYGTATAAWFGHLLPGLPKRRVLVHHSLEMQVYSCHSAVTLNACSYNSAGRGMTLSAPLLLRCDARTWKRNMKVSFSEVHRLQPVASVTGLFSCRVSPQKERGRQAFAYLTPTPAPDGAGYDRHLRVYHTESYPASDVASRSQLSRLSVPPLPQPPPSPKPQAPLSLPAW